MLFFFALFAAYAQQGDPGNGTPGQKGGIHINRWGVEAGHDFNMHFNLRYEFNNLQKNDSLIYSLDMECPINEQTLTPTDITISGDGEVSWNPSSPGKYYFGVKATLARDASIFHIVGNIAEVRGAKVKPCNAITGNLTLPSGYNPKSKIRVMAYKIDGNDYDYNRVECTVQNGKYKLPVSAGQYKLMINMDYMEMPYPLGSTLATAQVFTVACNADTVRQDIVITNEQLPEKIYFTSEFDEEEYGVGDTLIYDANAVSNKNSELRYRLMSEDNNSSIDPVTGLVKIYLDKLGANQFGVYAYKLSDTNIYAYQKFSFYVKRGYQTKTCAKIKGSLGLPQNILSFGLNNIKGLRVVARKVNTLSDSISDIDFYGEISNDGNYSINVPNGKYLVEFWAQNYGYLAPSAYWYKDATMYEVACSQEVVANFDLSSAQLEDVIIMARHTDIKDVYSIGDTVKFDVDAYSIKGNTVHYRYGIDSKGKSAPPADAILNANTGEFQWIANVKGNKTIHVETYIVVNNDTIAGPAVMYSFKVKGTVSTETCSAIKGIVKDENGAPIADATVFVMSIDKDEDMEQYWKADSTNANGEFLIMVPEGTYYAYIQKYGYEEYEEGSESIIEAECGDTTLLNVELKAYKEPTLYTVSGRVYDESTNEGIQAEVTFISADDNGLGKGKGKGHQQAMTITTDANGVYSAQISSDVNFVVFAEPTRISKKEYIREYYNNVTDIEDAEIIELSADRSGIDFGLAKRAGQTIIRKINGAVKDANGVSVRAVVTAIRVPGANENQNDYTFENATTDTAGVYHVNIKRAGDYILFAMPINKPLMPGFYVANAVTTWNWEEATKINVAETVDSTNTASYLIKLASIGTNPGNGIVKGSIAEDGSKMGFMGGSAKAFNGLKGVLVTAFNSANQAVKYVYTDDNGKFEFNGLSYGKFTIAASKVAYSSNKTVVTLNSESNNSDASMNLTPKSGTVSGVEELVANDGASIYPNPAVSSASLVFAANEGPATITITDMRGAEMLSIKTNATNGINNTTLDLSSLNGGAYLVRISTAKGEKMTMLNVVK
jgi:hypothetical protein